MESIKVNPEGISDFVRQEEIDDLYKLAKEKNKSLHQKTGKGSDFLGWISLASNISDDEIKNYESIRENIGINPEFAVVIGIGGSYLGAKAVIEALSGSFSMFGSDYNFPKIIYAGHHLNNDYHAELLRFLENRSYIVIVISKSGTTTEPAVVFRLLKNQLEEKYGKENARQRIIAITDSKKGALKLLADKEGYSTYVIPDDVGGRYSVLTPVGLIPIALAGLSVRKLIEGARYMENKTSENIPANENPAIQYAIIRNILYSKSYNIEILVSYHPKLAFFAEWWKQLFGESEGKENKGIFPASVNFTTDLHSMGQYIQEGRRNLFETVLSINSSKNNMKIPFEKENSDGLNFLSNKSLFEVNRMAELGTLLAHIDGGTPNIRIDIPELNEFYLGQLIYFFEKSCAISGYLIEVNPFDQPGVEAYKKNMFALLGKPGFENETKVLKNRLKIE